MVENQKNNENLTAKHVGVIKIGEIEIKCAVLSNEKRVFFQREIVGALTGHKKGGIQRYFNAQNLQPYVPEKYKDNKLEENVIKFDYNSKPAYGYEATDLIDICNMYIQARNNDDLLPSQVHLATRSDIIVNAFAKTGVIALIDEATGYQKLRKKDALRLLVESYIIEDARKWMKEFPDEFFEELDRIYNNPKTSPQKRPMYYGKFINKYIYQPIENGIVLEKINELNPPNETGARRKRLHQYLNEQKGIQVLRNRIGKITALLQISSSKRRFEENYKRMESKQKAFDFYYDEVLSE